MGGVVQFETITAFDGAVVPLVDGASQGFESRESRRIVDGHADRLVVDTLTALRGDCHVRPDVKIVRKAPVGRC